MGFTDLLSDAGLAGKIFLVSLELQTIVQALLIPPLFMQRSHS